MRGRAARGTSAADYYAIKADYKAGKLTPSAALPKGSGSSCRDDLVEIPCVWGSSRFNGNTSGSLNTVDTLPLPCNGNYTTAPGPDDIYMFTITGSPNLGTFTAMPVTDAYDPSIYMLAACGDGSTCVACPLSCCISAIRFSSPSLAISTS